MAVVAVCLATMAFAGTALFDAYYTVIVTQSEGGSLSMVVNGAH